MDEAPYKRFIVVPKKIANRKHLKFLGKTNMSPGKMGSQIAHAVQRQAVKDAPELVRKWQLSGETVIVLQIDGEKKLKAFHDYLNENEVQNTVYIDEGVTEVDEFTCTCLVSRVCTPEDYFFFSLLELYK